MPEIINISYEKFKLDNGLEVILYPDTTIPLISVNLWYKAGSANEVKGKTGLAHLFEHMMFQGSQNVPKGDHFKLIQEAGGTLNGSTSIDRTNYYETLPANFLEMALWLESDRMGFLLPALDSEKLENQRSVVMNERKQKYDNQPYGLAWEKLFSNLFPPNHPYHWPTIGWMDDIKNYTLEETQNFFKTYYSPGNASLVVAGNFKKQTAKELVHKYFDDIPAFKLYKELKAPYFELSDVKKIIHPDNIQLPRIYLAWKSDKVYGKDDAALDILSDILSGSKNSRLYKSLVFDKQTAQDVSAFQYSGNIDGAFIIAATAKPGVELHTLREEIFFEINKITSEGITDEELFRSKNSIRSSFIYSLQKLESMANQINSYNCALGEPNSFNYDFIRYDNVKKENVPAAALKYFNQPFVELNIIPKNEENK